MKKLPSVLVNHIVKCGASCICVDKMITFVTLTTNRKPDTDTNTDINTNIEKEPEIMNIINTYKEEQLQCYKYKNFRFIEYSLQRMKKEQK